MNESIDSARPIVRPLGNSSPRGFPLLSPPVLLAARPILPLGRHFSPVLLGTRPHSRCFPFLRLHRHRYQHNTISITNHYEHQKAPVTSPVRRRGGSFAPTAPGDARGDLAEAPTPLRRDAPGRTRPLDIILPRSLQFSPSNSDSCSFSLSFLQP